MAKIDLHKEYNSSGESVQEFFSSLDEGFVVPIHQREYTWEDENINQLFDDLISGVNDLTKDNNTTTFLGTTILTEADDRSSYVKSGENRAEPKNVQIVIDGQQRISTLALISIQLIEKLKAFSLALLDDDLISVLNDARDEYLKQLKYLHVININRGSIPLKPRIISSQNDKWTFEGDDDTYKSPVSRYIATFLRENSAEKALNSLDPVLDKKVIRNVSVINEWVDRICASHVTGENLFDHFPVGNNITTDDMQKLVLGFSDEKTKAIKTIVDKKASDKDKPDYQVVSIYQLFVFVYFLLYHCGFNRLQPRHEEWGFNMFQALNATGTPLTAMETFLPQVMKTEEENENDWEGAMSKKFMDEIQDLFQAVTTNEQKNSRTNELLKAFALNYDGTKLGNRFSDQRRWLTQEYEKQLTTIDQKHEFLEKLAGIANFYFHGWYFEDAPSPKSIEILSGHSDGNLASFLVRYLKDANSKLSTSILARFYYQAKNDDPSADVFIESAKACAAFFTLWRSARSTSGLDEVYRNFFKGGKMQIPNSGNHWKGRQTDLTATELKDYFRRALEEKGIGDKKSWMIASEPFLLYTELKKICRFVLFLSAHDRIPHKNQRGMTTKGINGSCAMLTLEQWLSKDYKSIEHIAPRNQPNNSTWDSSIYQNSVVHQVGNLMLLPLDLNQRIGNKNWPEKYLYYCHVGERDQAKLNGLHDAAKMDGISLNGGATKLLKRMKYSCAAEPISKLGADDGVWDVNLIEKRTKQSKEIAWDILHSWLK